jgi:hypothetical protein
MTDQPLFRTMLDVSRNKENVAVGKALSFLKCEQV